MAWGGFSLAEVVIAIGIVSFALLAMMGLLSVGLKGSQESTEDTSLALCTEAVLSELRPLGFLAISTNAAYQPGDATPDFFFDADGRMQRDANGLPRVNQSADSQYSCIITRRTPTLDQATTNLLYLQLKFTWPLAAPSASRQHRVVVSSIANYE